MTSFKIPDAPNSIQKGFPLKQVLDRPAITQLAENIHIVHPTFNTDAFIKGAMSGLEPLGIKQRAEHIGDQLRVFLPELYVDAMDILIQTLTPPLERTEDNGLAPMFYMPHCSFIEKYGSDPANNGGKDPFDVSMKAQYELTQRFTCEFSVRPFIAKEQERTLNLLYKWMKDSNPHVRRLCTEGTRPRLPWASKLSALAQDPTPVLPILENLKNDPDLYVRRSVANHVGDIAKDHLDLALDLCEKWLNGASKELKWVIRHALRNPFKKGNERAIELRKAAK